MEVIEAAIDKLLEFGRLGDEPLPPCKSANLWNIRTHIEEGTDPHDTILQFDVKLYPKISNQEDTYDPCEPNIDSKNRHSLTEASLEQYVGFWS